MTHSLPAPSAPPHRLPARLRRQGGLLALAAFLHGLPALANEAERMGTAEARSLPGESIAWMSGGVGAESRQELRGVAANYNVHLLFSGRRGAYLSGIPFTVARRDGRPLASGVSDGPMLYLQLPAGTYRIAVEMDGVWQTRSVQAGTAGRARRVSFVARSE